MEKELEKIKILKKDGTYQDYNFEKIKQAVTKTCNRCGIVFSHAEWELFKERVEKLIKSFIHKTKDPIMVVDMHGFVIESLRGINFDVSSQYEHYRETKKKHNEFYRKIHANSSSIMYDINRENANVNSALISTKKSLVAGQTAKTLYQELNLTKEEVDSQESGFIYIHDLTDRYFASINCCLFDLKNVLKDGFVMNNLKYTEPKTIITACSVAGDVIMASSAQQYGGHTTPEIDRTLAKYCENSYQRYIQEITREFSSIRRTRQALSPEEIKHIESIAYDKTYEDIKQGFQSLEVKLNTVVNARGSFPFTTFTFGDCQDKWAPEISKAILEVRKGGQGQDKKIQIFPKLVFLYNPELHGEGKPLNWLFNAGVECSQKAMYPDFLSPKFHKREGKWVSPMGCRAYLSDYRDENGELQFIGRGNIGAISLNLPLIYQSVVSSKPKDIQKSFFEKLEYYLQMIRKIHLKTYAYMFRMKASSNPLGFMEGGFYKGNLKADDTIESVLRTFTASFGVTALNELTELHEQQSILNNNKNFVKEVMDFIYDKIQDYKKEDGFLYAIYGTPAESLCGTQLKQFRNMFGVIKNVSDREYFTNSFHCHVKEEIDPFTKQDNEIDLFQKFMGGHIQYSRISNPDNFAGMVKIIERAMDLGFYAGVNFNASHCDDCGKSGNDFGDTCPHCKSHNVTEFNRTCGYLGYSKVFGNTTFNDAKMAEIKDRKSM
ncbi:MAG: anaerobic ribonucleoside-triphosphate reductase [Mycoplasma sp.]